MSKERERVSLGVAAYEYWCREQRRAQAPWESMPQWFRRVWEDASEATMHVLKEYPVVEVKKKRKR